MVVLGPPWLGAAIARGGRTLLLVESELRPQALRAHRRAKKESQPLDVALAAAELPFGRGTLSALVVENVAGLPPAEGERWIAALMPLLRPGGRLIAADATSSDAAAARVAGAFLAAALLEIVQEWPREGAVLTVGVAPAAVRHRRPLRLSRLTRAHAISVAQTRRSQAASRASRGDLKRPYNDPGCRGGGA